MIGSLFTLLRADPTRNSCKITLNPKTTIVSMRIPRMVRDPVPRTLLRITICQRNKDHRLGSHVRIMYCKNPALTTLNPKRTIVSMRIPRILRDHDPGILLRITICQRNKDHWLGSHIRITCKDHRSLKSSPNNCPQNIRSIIVNK